MDARTQKSELTRAAIVGAALDLASAEGLEAITLQAVAGATRRLRLGTLVVNNDLRHPAVLAQDRRPSIG